MRTELPARTQVARSSSPAGSNISNPPQNNSGSGVIRPPSPPPASQLQGQPQTVQSGLPSSLRPRVIRRPSNATPPQNPSSNGLPANLVPTRAPPSMLPLRTPKETYPFAASRPSAEFVHTSSPLSATPTVAQLPRSESPVSVRSQQSQKLPSSKSIPTPEPPQPRREHNNRVSFFDPLNQAALDRLVAGDYPEDGSAGEEETSQATMASVEEMLEGFEWASDDFFGKKNAKGAADLVEARLLDELIALEKVNQALEKPHVSQLLIHVPGQYTLLRGVR
jgi:hypothetical protein